MGLSQAILNRLKKIEMVKRLKEAISTGLQIQWETNPEKMQFDKLRSYSSLNGFFDKEILRVENIDIASTENIDYASQYRFIDDPESYGEMIDIIMKGGKLIPPAICESYAIVDGIEKMVRSAIQDGYHRIELARCFGMQIIPAVIFKSSNEYWFTPEKWSFEIGRIKEEKQIVGGTSFIEYNGIKATSKEGAVVIFKDYGTSIDDSNLDYLVIRTTER